MTDPLAIQFNIPQFLIGDSQMFRWYVPKWILTRVAKYRHGCIWVRLFW